MIVQAILIGLIAAWGSLDYAFGTLYTFRPIVLGPLVGLVLGDVKTGVEIGASLELLFMGAISVGAYIPPDVNIGGVLATAFAISMGKGVDAAVALAMPIAVISLGIGNLVSAITPVCLKMMVQRLVMIRKSCLRSGSWEHLLPSINFCWSLALSMLVLIKYRLC